VLRDRERERERERETAITSEFSGVGKLANSEIVNTDQN